MQVQGSWGEPAAGDREDQGGRRDAGQVLAGAAAAAVVEYDEHEDAEVMPEGEPAGRSSANPQPFGPSCREQLVLLGP